MSQHLSPVEKRIREKVGQCIADFQLIEEGDRVMVACSGGKDSYGMLHILERLRQAAPVKFELLAVHLDQGQPGFRIDTVERMLERMGVPHKILREHTYPIVADKTRAGQAPCFICSRLRRGILYRAAGELGCNKIALGHHRDDVIDTLMLNLFRTGQLKAMPPKLKSDDGRNIVIRPLAYVPEPDMIALAEEMQFEIAPCTLCSGNEEQARHKVRRLMTELEKDNPHLRGNIFAATQNVRVTHLLDRNLFDFDEAELPHEAAGAVV
jgi:tRNA 2-thiocytidine biosynthesis protein TtcA